MMDMQGLMAEHAGQSEDEAADQQLFQELSDGVSDYIHGEGRDAIVAGVAESAGNLPGTIGALSYEIVLQVSDQLAEQAPESVGMDIMFGLATEAIDYLIEIADAVGVPIQDVEDLRADSLMHAVELHMAAVEDDPEEKAFAEQMLAEFMADGTFDQAQEYTNQRLRKENVDPRQVQAQGQQMAAGMPRQDPLASGVQQGLQQQPPAGSGLMG